MLKDLMDVIIGSFENKMIFLEFKKNKKKSKQKSLIKS